MPKGSRLARPDERAIARKIQARRRLARVERRVRRIRGSVAMTSVTVFLAVWVLLAVQMTGGHDPALASSRHTRARAALHAYARQQAAYRRAVHRREAALRHRREEARRHRREARRRAEEQAASGPSRPTPTPSAPVPAAPAPPPAPVVTSQS